MIPARGNLLVRPVETEEVMPGGRIILTQNAREDMAAHQMEIVGVGLAEVCEDRDECDRRNHLKLHGMPNKYWHSVDERLKPGAWCYIRPRSLIDACHPTKKLYFIKQSDVMAVFREENPAG